MSCTKTELRLNGARNGKSGKEGRITDKTKYVVRIDSDITKDAELSVRA